MVSTMSGSRARKSVRIEKMRRVSTVSAVVERMLKVEARETSLLPWGLDFRSPSIVRPVLVDFLDAVRESFGDGGEPEFLHEFEENVTQANHFSTLAGLLVGNTFELRDRRLDRILGASMPEPARKDVLLELVGAIDRLWERFGLRLLERYGSFLEAFKALDEDESGLVDKSEFTQAYVDILAAPLPEGALEAIGEHPIGLERPSMARPPIARRSSTLPADADVMVAVASAGSDVGSHAGSSRWRRSGLHMFGGRAPSIPQVNRMILKTEAEFLFDTLRAGEDRGLGQRGSIVAQDEIAVSMQALVMRITGLGQKVMENLRFQLVARYADMKRVFTAFGQSADGAESELTSEEFREMYCTIVSAPPECADSPSGVEEARLRDTARRIFNGIDVDGSGKMTADEMRSALIAFGPRTPLGIMRRRLVLQFGSFDQFFHRNPTRAFEEEARLEALAWDLYVNIEDGGELIRTLRPEADEFCGAEPGADTPWRVPEEGYSVEELAIDIFLSKAEDVMLEELIPKRTDRDKEFTFREFCEKVVRARDIKLIESRGPGRQSSPIPNARGLAGAGPLGKLAAAKMASHVIAANAKAGRASRNSTEKNVPAVTTLFPIISRLADLKTVYYSLEREHRRVTLNILLNSMKNVSDIIALDRTSYQSGDCMFCRVRLSIDSLRKCKEAPFLVVVPQRMVWKDTGGGKGHWLLDGEKVTDMTAVGGWPYELPKGRAGIVEREACVRMMAPFASASEVWHEVRLISSPNGREPGKQVGRGVPLQLTMPAPSLPIVDQLSLDPITGEASAVLHWSAPATDASPIMHFNVQVEPLIYARTLVVESCNDQDEEDFDDDDGEGGYREVIVWSPALKAFTKNMSYKVTGLQRGVQYRFGVQGVHEGQDRQAVRGAASEFSKVATMPLYNATEAPGAPSVMVRLDGMLQLVWPAPPDEAMSDSNRTCTYLVQYRHTPGAGGIVPGSPQETESGSSDGSGEEDDNLSGSWMSSGENDGGSDAGTASMTDDAAEGWKNIEESMVFISQPTWKDFKGWEVPCLIVGLQPVGGETDDSGHEFRICSVNYTGKSPWSVPSEPIVLAAGGAAATTTSGVDSAPPAQVQNLEVVQVSSQTTAGGAPSAESRSQCILRWSPPASVDPQDPPRYAAYAKADDGAWSPVPIYVLAAKRPAQRLSVLAVGAAVEAVVMGLERFAEGGALQVQVRATTSCGSSVAEVELPGVETAADTPGVVVPDPPALVQVLAAKEGVVVQLQWPFVGGPGDPTPRYVLESAPAESVGEELEDVGFSVVEGACFGVPPLGDEGEEAEGAPEERPMVSCFCGGLAVGVYVFRVRVLGPGGELGEASPHSAAPVDLSEAAVVRRRRTSIFAGDAQSDTSMKKPRDLRVLGVAPTMCELSWDQRLLAGKAPPLNFEVEECQEDPVDGPRAEPVWRPSRSTYVTVEDLEDGATTCVVKAAVFFSRPLAGERLWRVRVRAPGSEWSTPLPWQPPLQPPPPAQPSAPAVVRSELQLLVLEWSAEEADAEAGASFELQLQSSAQRRGVAYSDWAPVAMFAAAAVGAPRRFRGVVERSAVAEAAHLGSGQEGLVRFRVRATSRSGVSGLPSEPSEATATAYAHPPLPEPSAPELLARGWIVVQSTSGVLEDAEFLRLRWRASSRQGGDAEVHRLAYELETEDEEHGLWVPVSGVLVDCDRKAATMSALVPLPSGGRRLARFRVAARGAGAAEAYSSPSPVLSWGLPLAMEAPRIVAAEPSVLTLRFALPAAVARAGRSARLWANVEEERHEERPSTHGRRPTKTSPEWAAVGDFPVLWQAAPAPAELPPGAEAAAFDADDCTCEGVVLLRGVAARAGAALRVALRVRQGQGEEWEGQSAMSEGAVVAPVGGGARAALRLEYPTWTGQVPEDGGARTFFPRLSSGIAVGEGTWSDEVVDGARLRFEVSAGALDERLQLDEHTGELTVVAGAAGDALPDFAVRACVLRPWTLQGGGAAAVGATASSRLQALVAEEALEACRALLREPAVSSAGGGGRSIVAAVLANPKLLPVLGLLQAASEGGAGDCALDAATKLLRLPMDALVAAAGHSADELVDLLCGSEEDGSFDGSDSQDAAEECGESPAEAADPEAVMREAQARLDAIEESCLLLGALPGAHAHLRAPLAPCGDGAAVARAVATALAAFDIAPEDMEPCSDGACLELDIRPHSADATLPALLGALDALVNARPAPGELDPSGAGAALRAALGLPEGARAEVTPRWAFERAGAELCSRLGCEPPPADAFGALDACLADQLQLFDRAWRQVVRREPATDIQALLALQTRRRFWNPEAPEEGRRLLSMEEGGQLKWPLSRAAHGTAVLAEVMRDAQEAHGMLKQMLAGGGEWESEPWCSRVRDPLPHGEHHDLGLKAEEEVLEEAADISGPTDEGAGIEAVTVSRVAVVFDSSSCLLRGAEWLLSHADVMWVDNRFRNPHAAGYRDMRFGVRLFVPVGEGHRAHMVEVRLALKELHDALERAGGELDDAAGVAVAAAAGLPEDQRRRARRLLLHAMARTDGQIEAAVSHNLAVVAEALDGVMWSQTVAPEARTEIAELMEHARQLAGAGMPDGELPLAQRRRRPKATLASARARLGSSEASASASGHSGNRSAQRSPSDGRPASDVASERGDAAEARRSQRAFMAKTVSEDSSRGMRKRHTMGGVFNRQSWEKEKAIRRQQSQVEKRTSMMGVRDIDARMADPSAPRRAPASAHSAKASGVCTRSPSPEQDVEGADMLRSQTGPLPQMAAFASETRSEARSAASHRRRASVKRATVTHADAFNSEPVARGQRSSVKFSTWTGAALQERLAAAVKEAPRPTVQLRYPQMPPFWPAFVDVRFEADIQFGAGRNTPAPPALRFDVAPELPAGVALDADTGGIRGSPLMEQGAGRQYIVTARWSDGSAVAAVCAFSAAVVPTDVAVVCNRAFFGGRAGFATPSFQAETPPPRPGRAEGPETAAAAEGGDAEGPVAALPRAACRDEGPLPALPRAAGARRAPIGAARATASPRTPGVSPTPISVLGAVLARGGEKAPSRTAVFPLGPPLRDRPAASLEASRTPTSSPPGTAPGTAPGCPRSLAQGGEWAARRAPLSEAVPLSARHAPGRPRLRALY